MALAYILCHYLIYWKLTQTICVYYRSFQNKKNPMNELCQISVQLFVVVVLGVRAIVDNAGIDFWSWACEGEL